METELWFKLKKYPHIGLPITIFDYSWVKKYVTDYKKITTHSFLPLIHKCISQRKFRPDSERIDKTITKRRFRIKDKKDRNIYFASHIDSLIYSYYNSILVESYENHIKGKNFNESVVAYRRIPLYTGASHNKCNIDFAKSTFEFIREHNSKSLSVIVADVTSFFDNLDHEILKRQWTKILGKGTLPADHYNVFKSLTKIKFIEGEQLFNSYDKTMIVERGVPNNSKKREFKRIKIQRSQFFKEKNAVSYCKKDEFLSNNLNLIISKNNKCGIPQGSPISATLANVYMLDFDQIVSDKVENVGGFYQRYSDDLIIICEQKYEDEIIKCIRENIENEKIANLEIQTKKTKVYRFENINGNFKGFEIDEMTKQPNFNKTLEYLGFSYDGQKVLIKTSGFSKFYRSMIKSFKKSSSLAKNSKNPNKNIFKSRLYKRFTHKGSKRKLIFRPSKDDNTKYVASKEYSWGNYLSYVYKADYTMKDLNDSNYIKRQSRKMWQNFHRLMKMYS